MERSNCLPLLMLTAIHVLTTNGEAGPRPFVSFVHKFKNILEAGAYKTESNALLLQFNRHFKAVLLIFTAALVLSSYMRLYKENMMVTPSATTHGHTIQKAVSALVFIFTFQKRATN